jgi:putative hemolysin
LSQIIYFKYGVKICSYPAIDREFKTIDFLVLLDLNDLSIETKMLFLLPIE